MQRRLDRLEKRPVAASTTAELSYGLESRPPTVRGTYVEGRGVEMEVFEGVRSDQMLSVGVRRASRMGQQSLLLPGSGDVVRYDAPDDLECGQLSEWSEASNPAAVLERSFGHKGHFCAE